LKSEGVLAVVLAGLAVLGSFLSLAGFSIPSPAVWLQEWTTWIATVIVIITSARALWVAASWLAARTG
jgi:hypothetical protein